MADEPRRPGEQDPTQPVEVQRYGPAAEPPTTEPNWQAASAWTSREHVAPAAAPARRGPGAAGIVALALIAGILSGALSAFAAVNLMGSREAATASPEESFGIHSSRSSGRPARRIG
jgi:hypothetical protein